MVGTEPIYELNHRRIHTGQWQSARSVSFKIDTYDAKKPDEEPDEIDESSFMDILNAGE